MKIPGVVAVSSNTKMSLGFSEWGFLRQRIPRFRKNDGNLWKFVVAVALGAFKYMYLEKI